MAKLLKNIYCAEMEENKKLEAQLPPMARAIVQANQEINNRLAEIIEEAEFKALMSKKEHNKYIENDPRLKDLRAYLDALVRVQPAPASGFPFAFFFFFFFFFFFLQETWSGC